VKCVMRKNPFLFVFTAYLMSIPFFGWMLRIAERPFVHIDDSSLGYNYANAMWNIIITMTTVGYGDIYPRTLLGRGIVFFVCIWGTMIISLMVVTLTTIFEMNSLEFKAFNILERLSAKEKMRSEAAHVLTNIIRGKNVSKNQKKNSEKHLEQTKNHLKSFKAASRYYRELSDQSTGFDDVMRNFELLREQVVDVTKNQKFITAALREIMPSMGVEPQHVEKLVKQKTEAEQDKSKLIAKESERDKDGKFEFLITTEGNQEEEEYLVNEEVVNRKQVPFYASINESPEEVRLFEN